MPGFVYYLDTCTTCRRAIKEMRVPVEELGWFLDTRRFGTVPHAGFGLGLERFVRFVTGMGSIRGVIPSG